MGQLLALLLHGWSILHQSRDVPAGVQGRSPALWSFVIPFGTKGFFLMKWVPYD